MPMVSGLFLDPLASDSPVRTILDSYLVLSGLDGVGTS